MDQAFLAALERQRVQFESMLERQRVQFTTALQNSRPPSPFDRVQESLPEAVDLKQYMFYFHENNTKSCVVAIDLHFAVTFRHGTHLNYNKDSPLSIYREIDNTAYLVNIVEISERFDFILLHSNTQLIDKAPPIANASPGHKIGLLGYGNDYQTISYRYGNVFVAGELCLVQGNGDQMQGPFMVGTVPAARGDSGASCWSCQGLVGINLGILNMPEHLQTAPNAINEAGQHSVNNYMVKSWRIVEAMEVAKALNLIKGLGKEERLKSPYQATVDGVKYIGFLP